MWLILEENAQEVSRRLHWAKEKMKRCQLMNLNIKVNRKQGEKEKPNLSVKDLFHINFSNHVWGRSVLHSKGQAYVEWVCILSLWVVLALPESLVGLDPPCASMNFQHRVLLGNMFVLWVS